MAKKTVREQWPVLFQALEGGVALTAHQLSKRILELEGKEVGFNIQHVYKFTSMAVKEGSLTRFKACDGLYRYEIADAKDTEKI